MSTDLQKLAIYHSLFAAVLTEAGGYEK